jgi:hypothetical protein
MPNPLMDREWLDCQCEIQFLKSRIREYRENGDPEAADDAAWLLEQEEANLRAIEMAGGGPTDQPIDF